ncbi:MAG: PKD domain-containing protein [Cytophagales bacterium]|nr:MAG: PKD domain-containing protein [Cytophagales bacterium]
MLEKKYTLLLLLIMFLGLSVGAKAQTANFTTATPTTGCVLPVGVQFTALPTGGTPVSYVWDFGNGTGSALANPVGFYTAAGSYTVTLTITFSGGITDTEVKTNFVQTIASPLIELGSDQVTCASTYTLNLTNVTGINYSWSNKLTGDFTGIFTTDFGTCTVNQSGLYMVSALNTLTGCVSTDSVRITIVPPPVIPLPTEIKKCNKDTITVLNALHGSHAAGVNYKWFKNGVLMSGVTTASISVKDTSATAVYSVVVTETSSPLGCNNSKAVAVTYSPAPIVNLPDSLKSCDSLVSLTYTALGGVTYSWRNAAGTTAGIVSGAATATAVVNVSGKYILTVTNTATSCSAKDSMIVVINKKPKVDLKGPFWLCNDVGRFIISAKDTSHKAGTTYKWYRDGILVTGSTKDTLGVYTPSLRYRYRVEVISAAGCLVSDTVTVGFNPVPIFKLQGHDPLKGTCAKQDTLFVPLTNVDSFYTKWTGPGLAKIPTDSLSAIVNKSGTYSLVVTNKFTGCRTKDSINVVFYTPPVIKFAKDSLFFCVRDSATLLNAYDSTHDLTAKYEWFKDGTLIPSATKAILKVLELGTHQYRVRVTNISGCTGTDTIYVTYYPEPTFSIVGVDEVRGTCQPTDTLFTAGEVNSMTLEWFRNGILVAKNQKTLIADSSGVYMLKVTNPFSGCFNYDTVKVTIYPPLELEIGSDTVLCELSPLVLSGFDSTHTATTQYEWWLLDLAVPSRSEVLGTTQTFVARFQDKPTYLPRTYALVAFDTTTGCSVSDTLTVTFERQPEANALPKESVSICFGDSTALIALGSETSVFEWVLPSAPDSVISRDSIFVVKPLITTTYMLRATGQNSCQFGYDSVKVIVNDPPKVSILPATRDSIIICPGTPITLTAFAERGRNFYWWHGDSTAQTTVAPLDTTTYYVTVIDDRGCIGFDSVTIMVTPRLKLPALISGCMGDSIQIGARLNDGKTTYLWSTGDTSAYIWVDSSGIYSLTVKTDSCLYTLSTTVDLHPIPKTDLKRDTILCFEEDESQFFERKSFKFKPEVINGREGEKYLFRWYDTLGNILSRKQELEIDSGGVYIVRITSDFGCIGEDTLKITERCEPRIYIPDAFTPNKDDLNERFTIFGAHFIRLDFYIYDRWNECVFQLHAPTAESMKETDFWDGTFKNEGKAMPPDRYFWMLEYYSIALPYKPIRKTGSLILIR